MTDAVAPAQYIGATEQVAGSKELGQSGAEENEVDHNEALVERHDRRFVALELRATDLEKDMARVIDITDRLDNDFYNHGRDGIKTQFLALVNEMKGARNQQATEHQENSAKLNIIMAICAIATILILAVSCVVTWEVAKRSELDPAKIFHSQGPIQAYYHSQKLSAKE
jgi:hypothetical protein